MSIASLFQSLHGMLDTSTLVPINNMRKTDLEAYGISIEDVVRVSQELEMDTQFLFYNPDGGLYPFCYWDGFFYYGFHGFQNAIMKVGDDPRFHESTRFKYQRKYMYDKLAEKDWDGVIAFADKKVSFLVFEYLRQKTNMPPKKQKEMFLEIYARNEYGFDRLDEAMVRDILNMPTPNKYVVPLVYQPDKERYYTIYRGETSESSPLSKAYSWTLEHKVAEFFATRFQSDGRIHKRRVHKDNIKAFIPNRDESEVIVLPEDVRRIKGE